MSRFGKRHDVALPPVADPAQGRRARQSSTDAEFTDPPNARVYPAASKGSDIAASAFAARGARIRCSRTMLDGSGPQPKTAGIAVFNGFDLSAAGSNADWSTQLRRRK